MQLIAHVAFWLEMGFLLSLMSILLWKILRGKISLKGIFLGDLRNGRVYFSVGRVQFLICVTAVTFDYVTNMVTRSTQATLPSIDPVWLALLGGSGMFYLAEKAFGLWIGLPYRFFQKGR